MAVEPISPTAPNQPDSPEYKRFIDFLSKMLDLLGGTFPKCHTSIIVRAPEPETAEFVAGDDTLDNLIAALQRMKERRNKAVC